MNALFIGRFQPFHNGHLKVIQNFSNKFDEIIIGIGSSQYKDTIENPFSYEERKLMITKSLENIDVKNFRIELIPDIHNPPKWVEHVCSIINDFDIVLTNNSFTKKLFLDSGYLVQKTPIYKREIFSGKNIRNKIKNGEEWKNLVPKEVFKIIQNLNGEERLKKL